MQDTKPKLKPLGLSNAGNARITNLHDNGYRIPIQKIGSRYKGIKTVAPILEVRISPSGTKVYTCRGTWECS